LVKKGMKKRVLQNKTSRVAAKASTLGGQDKEKKTDNKSTCLSGSNSGLTSSTGLTGDKTGLTRAPSKPGNF